MEERLSDRFRELDVPLLVARLNLPNLRYAPERKLEVFLRAQEGLATLETDPEKRIKYNAFIDHLPR